jgi:hypothetical protein
MFNLLAAVTETMDNTDKIKQLIDDIAKKQVFVGIPEADNTINHSEGHSGIKNAELLYILSHGVRSTEMIDEMDITMGIDEHGMPYTADYNKFLDQMSNGKPYSAAYQMYIQAHGSALWKTPPRPVLEPSIEHNKDAISQQLGKVAKVALSGNDPNSELQKAGMMAQNFARDWFTNPANLWPPNAESTIKKKGSDRPMIDQGELRRAITYVVKDE